MLEQEKYIYADKTQQVRKVNRLSILTYGLFVVCDAIVMLISCLRGYRSLAYTIAIISISVIFLVAMIAANTKENQLDKVKWLSMIGLCMVGFMATYAFDSYYMRFAVVAPMVVYILYYDSRYMLTSGIAMGVIQVITTATKYFLGSGEIAFIDILSSTAVVIFFIVLICLVERTGKLFQEHMLGSIEAEKDQQAAMMQDVIYVASEVRKGTKGAMDIVNQLNASTGVVTGAVKDISDSTQSTAENIQKQTVMTQNIQSAIEETIARSESMVTIADKSKELNGANLQIMNNIKDQSKTISGTNANVADTMAALQERANAVKGIADTIFSISSQTNLLALNASIESARAGEAGRGFAVVADEIRQLAEKTRLETENIAAILDELSENAAAAVGAVEQSAEATRQQDALINQAAESFEEMNVNVNELTQNISEIDTMLTHLSEANNQIVDSITHLSATTQQVTASSAQAENVSSKNLQNADDTKEILNQVLSVSQQLDKYVQTEA